MRLGVCYYPEHWPEAMWAEDAARMRDMGISLVRIAEFAWSRIEPEPGRLEWGWLDRAVDVLAAAGLEIVMCTPTATPPKWLVDRIPQMLAVDANGSTRKFGSRRHYCFSSPEYFEEARRISTAVAERYGNHPAVAAWQTDNEYGCHFTTVSYSQAAQLRFRAWLAERYGTIDALNTAWATVFWSQEYQNFDQIDSPVGTVTEANPSHRLDYRRFASDALVRFNRMQTEILREHSPGRPICHNFMQFFTEFDHHAVARDLDVAGWDSYPLGALESFWFAPELKAKWLRTGHPDFAAFHHDLYRGMSKQPFWVMEQQPGPVNWAAWNPAPRDGMVRLWSWEAFAHGADVVSYFRWRQFPAGQEQMHAGLNTPDNQLDVGGQEATQVGKELARVPVTDSSRAAVALVFDYDAQWLFEVHPQGADFDYIRLVFEYYEALRSLGLDIDIVAPDAPLAGYRLVVLPAQATVTRALVDSLKTSGAQIVIGPRSGSKTANISIPDGLPPDLLRELVPMRVWRVESLRPGVEAPVQFGESSYAAHQWREDVELHAGARAEATYIDCGRPAVVSSDRYRYLAGVFEPALIRAVLAAAARDADIACRDLPAGLRLRRRGALCFAFNYGDDAVDVDVPPNATWLLGSARLRASGVGVWREAT